MINLMYEHYGRVVGRIDAYCMFGKGMHSDKTTIFLEPGWVIDTFNTALVSGPDAFDTT